MIILRSAGNMDDSISEVKYDFSGCDTGDCDESCFDCGARDCSDHCGSEEW